jgi:hypothetical protein
MHGLRIVDVSNPEAPSEIRPFSTPDLAQSVTVGPGQLPGQTYAYVADHGDALRIIDVSNPAEPTEAAFYDTPGSARDVVLDGIYAWVADYDAGLVILRVAPYRVRLPLVLRNR